MKSDKKRVILIYDCPFKKCDKLWVYHGLKEAGYEVKVIDWPFRISHVDQRGRIGVILALIMIMVQSTYAVLLSKPDDVIFCWLQKSGIYCNYFARGKRKIISYNWLTPRPKKSTRKLYADALENPLFHAIINSPENKEKNLQAYQAKDMQNIHYIPDVYEENAVFKKPVYEKKGISKEVAERIQDEKKRYCFMGGRANRDWKLFLETARNCPDLFFVGVAAACDWKKEYEIPSNVLMKFDISADEYYDLLSHAYLAFYLLEQDRVSGLINILKGAMEGIPVLVTDMPATRMYYDENYQKLLLKMGDFKDTIEKIRIVYKWNNVNYEKNTSVMQDYIQNMFSSKLAIERIKDIL